MNKADRGTLAQDLSRILIDPVTRGALSVDGDALSSHDGERIYGRGKYGYFDFTVGDQFYEMESTSEEYAGEQEESWRRFYLEYLKPWVERESAQRVLEVGSGMGMGIRFLREDGIEAYGIDIPCLAKFWARAGNDPAYFFNCDGARMPFPDGFFDAVYTLGTIEHIGTKVGHYTLEDNYWETRAAFAKEMLRVTKRGGRLLVTCPNKSFPIDIHHEPTDDATPPGKMKWRRYIFDTYGMTLHWPFGKYHLFSYSELKGLFCEFNQASSIEPLPLKHYFAFKRTGSLGLLRKLKSLIVRYIENMPPALRKSPLNPFLVVEIRK
ncbi:MAG TPA: class I SAM-dependent methyltransferase [Candidatus Hydrogenedentes bacterium]|nr:class I SAM-dependent methyltransferase [Candidatus Hydrogenedentota bacterium]